MNGWPQCDINTSTVICHQHKARRAIQQHLTRPRVAIGAHLQKIGADIGDGVEGLRLEGWEYGPPSWRFPPGMPVEMPFGEARAPPDG